MLVRIKKCIKGLFITPMSGSDKIEFTISIYRINIARVKITIVTFIILEAMMLALHCFLNREKLFDDPYIYYGFMYALMLVAMAVFFAIFSKLGADVAKYLACIRFVGILFIAFILLWCAGISLLDQLSSGQVIVYIVAIISIAITPFFEPLTLFLVYLTIHSLFLFAMPYFQKSLQLIYGNAINATTFVIISWAISYMRYQKQAEDFINKKTILRKNEELRLMNRQLQEANRKLEVMSMTDGLTGVFNRLSFGTIIKDEWDRCKRNSAPLSLIMVDIDFFKEFNDNYGHQAGDCCIKLVAELLTVYAKDPMCKVARYGGDELVVVLPYTDKKEAWELAEQVREGVEAKTIAHMGSTASNHVTISLGINTTIPSDESSIEEFIRSTDKALYMAKERRNCSVFAPTQLG